MVSFSETVTTTYGEVTLTFPVFATYNEISDALFLQYQNIFLVGSISQLGSWDTSSAVSAQFSPPKISDLAGTDATMQLPLSAGGYPTWTVSVILPPNTAFQYKFIRIETDGSVRRLRLNTNY